MDWVLKLTLQCVRHYFLKSPEIRWDTLTCVCGARVEQCVCVGDKLQLSVQVRQEAAWQSHVHLAVTFDFHPICLRCHIQRSQRGSDIYLQREGEKSRSDKSGYLKYVKVKTDMLIHLLSSVLCAGRGVRPSLKAAVEEALRSFSQVKY